MIKQITKQEYWQLTGLLTLAAIAMAKLDEIESSIRALLRAEEDDDYISDAVYNNYSADALLHKLSISRVTKRQKNSKKKAEAHDA